MQTPPQGHITTDPFVGIDLTALEHGSKLPSFVREAQMFVDVVVGIPIEFQRAIQVEENCSESQCEIPIQNTLVRTQPSRTELMAFLFHLIELWIKDQHLLQAQFQVETR